MPMFFFKKRRGTSGSNLADPLSPMKTSWPSRAIPRSVTSNPTSRRLMPSSFCFANFVAADEVTFVEFANPTEIGFEQVVVSSIS